MEKGANVWGLIVQYCICRDAGNEGDGPRHGGEGRECLRTNRTIFVEMPGMKEMAYKPA